MKWHWECAHGASKAQSKELKTLPLIVDMVRNRHFRHPGNGHPLLPPGPVPAGSYSPHEKGELLVGVSCVMTPRPEVPEERRVVLIAAPPSATTTAPKDPLPPSLPPPTEPLQSALQTSEEMSSPSARTTPLQAATHPMEGAPAASPVLLADDHNTPPSPDRPAPTPSRPDVTPITIPSDSETDRPWEPSPPSSSPAFTTQSTPGYSVGSPMQQDSSDQDPTLSPGSPALPIPPTPTRLQLPPDAFKAASPSGVPRLLQSATFSQNTGSPQRRRREVLGRLRAIEGRRSALEVEGLTALRDLAQVESEELQQTRQELVAAQEQCWLLQGWLDQRPAGVVGDLESLTTSYAMLLLPHMGFTKAYHLNQEDLLNVDILNRSPAMSCDRL